jgi:biotin operon repressor
MKTRKVIRRRSPSGAGEEWFDAETGEILDGFVMHVAHRKMHAFGERWLAMAQNTAQILAHSDLGGAEFKIMFLLISKLDFENHLLINQVELANELGMLRQNVNKSIKRLVEVGVILEGPKFKQNRSYKLNPEFGWKGSTANHKKELAAQRTKKMKAAKITGVIEGGKSDEEK